MTNYQHEKNLILNLYRDLDACQENQTTKILEKYTTPDYRWCGYHPFNEIKSPQNVAKTFWTPLKKALVRMQRRLDVFMAGTNTLKQENEIWVASMGHLIGLFDEAWLGIAPHHKIAMLRYAEFNQINNGKITQTALFIDIPHLMMQTGLKPFPPQTAAHLIHPGPKTHDGVMLKPQPPEEARKTTNAINRMTDDLKSWKNTQSEPLIEELRRSWHDDMLWWGPAGIGATYSIERYAQQHAKPFRQGFKNRIFNGHVASIAEGCFGGFFGWPNLTLTPTGGFMGMPATETPADMRVIDIYRRQDDKLAENWVFIDLLHFWHQQGTDILKRTTQTPRT